MTDIFIFQPKESGMKLIDREEGFTESKLANVDIQILINNIH